MVISTLDYLAGWMLGLPIALVTSALASCAGVISSALLSETLASADPSGSSGSTLRVRWAKEGKEAGCHARLHDGKRIGKSMEIGDS